MIHLLSMGNSPNAKQWWRTHSVSKKKRQDKLNQTRVTTKVILYEPHGFCMQIYEHCYQTRNTKKKRNEKIRQNTMRIIVRCATVHKYSSDRSNVFIIWNNNLWTTWLKLDGSKTIEQWELGHRIIINYYSTVKSIPKIGETVKFDSFWAFHKFHSIHCGLRWWYLQTESPNIIALNQ